MANVGDTENGIQTHTGQKPYTGIANAETAACPDGWLGETSGATRLSVR